MSQSNEPQWVAGVTNEWMMGPYDNANASPIEGVEEFQDNEMSLEMRIHLRCQMR